MSESFEIVLLTNADTGYVRTIEANHCYACGRKEEEVDEDSPRQYVHLPGCTKRYQFMLLWDESKQTFVIRNTASGDLTRINNELLPLDLSRSLQDGDVIEVERDSLRRAMDHRVSPSFMRILFRVKHNDRKCRED